MVLNGPGLGYNGTMVHVELERVEALELLAMTLAHLKDAQARGEVSPRVPLLLTIRDRLAYRITGGHMTYTNDHVSTAVAAIEKYRGSETGEVGAALAVVGLSTERVEFETQVRNDMIRVAHRSGASLRQLAEVSGLDRKTVTAIVG
jgi:hypothetical protein